MAFDNIKLDKGLYTSSKGFTKSLEEIDPSENYVGTELEGLDAFQRQLKRFNIKVNSEESDRVDKFFQTTDSAVLFPEYINRAVRQGMEQNDILSKIVATTTNIDSFDYRTIESCPEEEDKTLAEVAEGAVIPETVIKTKEELVRLKKRGRMLVATYEALKFQRLDLFTVTLKQIGAQIARDLSADAISALTENEDIEVSTKTQIDYQTIVELWNKFDPYTLTTVISNASTLEKILMLPEFRDSNAGLDFHATGKLITPLGAEIIKAPVNEGDFLLGIDKNYALEMVKAGDVSVEYDKIIDRQLERAAITSIAGFSPICSDATKAVIISAE